MEKSIATNIVALRKLAEYCSNGNKLNEMIHDRLACGVNQESIQARLLSSPTRETMTLLRCSRQWRKTPRSSNGLNLGVHYTPAGSSMDSHKHDEYNLSLVNDVEVHT